MGPTIPAAGRKTDTSFPRPLAPLTPAWQGLEGEWVERVDFRDPVSLRLDVMLGKRGSHPLSLSKAKCLGVAEHLSAGVVGGAFCWSFIDPVLPGKQERENEKPTKTPSLVSRGNF